MVIAYSFMSTLLRNILPPTGCFLKSLPSGVLSLGLQSEIKVCHCQNLKGERERDQEKGGKWVGNVDRREDRLEIITVLLNLCCKNLKYDHFYINKMFFF